MNLLLVDDDTDDIDIFREALASIDKTIVFNYSINGKKALTWLDSGNAPIPDLIFMDINMPLMDGWECLDILKKSKEYNHIPVIIYSTSSHKNLALKASEGGALCYFTKPDNYNRLKEIISIVVACIKQGDIANICNAIKEAQ